MSLSDRRKPPSQRRSRETAESRAFRGAMAEPEVDVDALNRISRSGGVASIDGEPVPLVRPWPDDPADHATFDALICQAGLTKFLRPRSPSDWGALCLSSHVLVEELSPGVRVRTPIEFYPDGALN